MSSIKTFFRHCPSCGRRFEIRLVEKKEISSEDILEDDKRPTPTGRFVTGSYTPMPITLQDDVPVMVDVKDFRYTYRCKHCGHQWSEVRTKEDTVERPEGYTGD
jgi:C4-type Zn-finger protein